MLEMVPQWLGRALRGVRAGADRLVVARAELPGDLPAMQIGSPAFADGGRLPIRFTADGEGVSPPLIWGQVPEGAAGLALIVEDADAPGFKPLVHAIVWNLPPEPGGLAEGGIQPDGAGSADGSDVGRASLFLEGWLPPDPPAGHGEHRYVFQIFALSGMGDLGSSPKRSALLGAMAGKILAAGVLTGTYSRGEEAPLGPGAVFAAPAR